MRPKGVPGDEVESARQRELQVLEVGKKVEEAVCADERSVCMIQLSRVSMECAPGEGRQGFGSTKPRSVDLNIERTRGAMRWSKVQGMVHSCLNKVTLAAMWARDWTWTKLEAIAWV